MLSTNSGLNLQSEIHPVSSDPNRQLEDEVQGALARLQTLDRGYVSHQTPKGKVAESGSFRYNKTGIASYRQVDSPKGLASVFYRKVEMGPDGKPFRQTDLSFCATKDGTRVNKTIQDLHGKTIIIGGSSRQYEAAFFPGHKITGPG